jgi:hypothetical protein
MLLLLVGSTDDCRKRGDLFTLTLSTTTRAAHHFALTIPIMRCVRCVRGVWNVMRWLSVGLDPPFIGDRTYGHGLRWA